MNRETTAFGRALLRLSASLCALFVCLMAAGCGQGPSGNRQGTTKTTKEVTLLVFVDRSGSIRDYPLGGLAGIQKTYMRAAAAFMKPVLSRNQEVKHVELQDFVNSEQVELKKDVHKWEEVSRNVRTLVNKPPYPDEKPTRLTLFSKLVKRLNTYCKSHPDQDIYVLILSDGKPDEPIKRVRQAADEFATSASDNLKYLVVAPVEPDPTMVHHWREDLQNALTPLRVAHVANSEDLSSVCKNALNKETSK